MSTSSIAHPAIRAGQLAVIAGSSSGIGLALAKKYVQAGMSVVMGDINEERLQKAAAEVSKLVKPDAKEQKVYASTVDVADEKSVEAFKKSVLSQFPSTPLTVLHANAGVGGPTKATNTQGWSRILNTNFHGVVNVCTAFVPEIQKQFAEGGALAKDASARAIVVNTGSKQGITCPPATGPAYNISKAAVKVYTEQLAHELRQDEPSRIDVKLLVPGFVWTALTGAEGTDSSGKAKSKPDAAWTPEQTADYFFERGVGKGSFYVICPDGETTQKMDQARMEWSMNDVLKDRTALSRWDKAYKEEFESFMQARV